MTTHEGKNRAVMTLTEVAGGTLVHIDYEIDRLRGMGVWDLFDFWGSEAAGWLRGTWQELSDQYAVSPWAGGHEPAPPGMTPPTFDVGASVAALALDGHPYHGKIMRTEGAMCLVLFDNGTEQWLSAHNVHAAQR